MKSLIPAWKFVSVRQGLMAHPLVVFVLLICTVVPSYGQTVSWSGSFTAGTTPGVEQCEQWNEFLNALADKTFASVTLTGSADNQGGKALNDAAAATQLAFLLSSRTPGVVTADGDEWIVTQCGFSACGNASYALSVNGNRDECVCSQEFYAVRPYMSNFGGVNTQTCGNVSQTITLTFHSGVTVIAEGPTEVCAGDQVVLTAHVDLGCEDGYEYSWSNGATTPSIVVSESGDYSVFVTNMSGGCQGTSSPVSVTVNAPTVDAGPDVVVCGEPVELNAFAPGGGAPAVFCLSGSAGTCVLPCSSLGSAHRVSRPTSYSTDVNTARPSEIRMQVYYRPFGNASLEVSLNGARVAAFTETKPLSGCAGSVTYPRTIVIPSELINPHWREGQSNRLTVDIDPARQNFLLGGIEAEFPGGSYAWSPSTGLDNPGIANPIATPEKTMTYTVLYTDPGGCTDTDDVVVTVDCHEPPVALCQAVEVSAGDGCVAAVEPEAFDNESYSGSEGALVYSVTPAGPYAFGTTEVVFTVTDSEGETASCTTTVTVTDTSAPVFPALADIIVGVDAAGCSASIELPAPAPTDNCGVDEITHDQTELVFPVGETVVTWTARDVHGNEATAAQKIIVLNDAPVINSFTLSATEVDSREAVEASLDFADDNIASLTIDWGDGSAAEVVTAPSTGTQGSHTYLFPGSFSVKVVLRDHCGLTVEASKTVDVTFQQKGHVTGNGWFESSRGYYADNGRASGKAQFHFSVKHHKESGVSGNVRFDFRDGRLEFKSTSIETLLIDDTHAFVSAPGKVNGKKGYHILLAMDDADQDKKRSIWDLFRRKKDRDKLRVRLSDPNGRVIYDTQAGDGDQAVAHREIGGGSIHVNVDKKDLYIDYREIVEEIVDAIFGSRGTSVYPNPFTDHLNLRYHAESDADVSVQLLDLTGEVIVQKTFPVSSDGLYFLAIPPHARNGIYMLMIKQGDKVDYLRLIRK